MLSPHDGGCSVVLLDGRILVSGGSDDSGPTAKVDIFNTDATWSSPSSMLSPRAHQVCAVLQSGQVLVVGGTTTGGGVTNSAELFDSTANTWLQLPAMSEARADATASVLPDGRVLVAGGQTSSGPSNTIEIFDPNAQTFSFAGAMSASRQDAAATVLADGRVLIVGGSGVDANGNAIVLASSDVYDPSTGSVSAGPTLTMARCKHTAITQLDGKVVVIGGSNGSNDLGSIEVFDPSLGGNFTPLSASLATARSGHLAFLLPKNNEVLVGGGQSAGVDLASAELYVPWGNQGTGEVQATSSMSMARSQASGAPLSIVDGLLIVSGGSLQTSAELYSFATVRTDQADYAPGTTVTITGTGWQPGEKVSLTLVESPLIDTHPALYAVADQNGNIFNNQFSPDDHDENVRFYLTATGSQSQAQNTFTDSPPTSTSTTLTTTPNPSNVGQSVTFTSKTTAGGGAVTVGCSTLIDTSNGNAVVGGPTKVDSSGQAVFGISTLAVGSHNIQANYAQTNQAPCGGTGNFANSHGTITQTVNKDNSSFTNLGASYVLTVGSSVTITGNVSAYPSATGTVAISVGGFTSPTGALSGASNSFQITFSPNLTPGTYPITYSYSGDANSTTAMDSITSTLTVYPVPIATSLTANPTQINVGSASQLTAIFNSGINGSGMLLPGNVSVTSGVPVSVSPTSTTTYTLIVQNGQGMIAANTPQATVTVIQCTPVSALSVQNVTVTYGQTAAFTSSISAGVTTPVTYQWLKNGSPISGATNSSFNYSPSVADSGSTFTVQASNACTNPAQSANALLTVNPAPASVTPNAASKIYGTTDPTFGGTLSGFLPSDNITATYGRTPGETVAGSPYKISATLSPAGALGNYNITYNTADFTINPAPAMWTTQDSSKTYGSTDPNPLTTGSGSGFLVSDGVTATYNRTAGETVAGSPYRITATLSASVAGALNNYSITNNGANFAINPAPLAITASSASVLYGDPVPTITPAYATFVNGDTASSLMTQPSCSTTYTSASPVGGSPYTTTCSGAVDSNYIISYKSGAVTVMPRPVTVTADAQTKVYGESDPSLTYKVTSGSLVNGDSFSGTLNRVAGDNVGTYAINQGTLVLSANYALTYVGQSLTINPRPITVSAVKDTKVYDGATSSSGMPVVSAGNLVFGNTLNYVQTFDSRNVGARVLTPSGSVSDGNNGNNYAVALLTAAGSIMTRPITVSAASDSKVYDGTAASSKTPGITSGSLATGDTVALSQTFDSRNAGVRSLIPSAVISDGNNGANYAVTYVNVGGSISQRPITVTAVTDTKYYDGTTATMPLTSPSVTSNLIPAVVGGDTPIFTEAFDNPNAGSRILGASGSVNDGNGGANYSVNFVSVGGTISPALTGTSLALSSGSSILGQSVTFTATVSNTKTSATPTGSVQFVIDGSVFSAVGLSGGTASFSTSSLAAGHHTVTAVYENMDGNFVNSGSVASSETVDYNFLGFYSPYAPPSAGVAYKINSAIPLQWQYADVNNNVVASPNANPQVYIAGPYACGGTDSATEVLALSSGASGYQYSTTNNEWQFNLKTTGLAPGCYNVFVNTGSTGQQTVAFPIQMR